MTVADSSGGEYGYEYLVPGVYEGDRSRRFRSLVFDPLGTAAAGKLLSRLLRSPTLLDLSGLLDDDWDCTSDRAPKGERNSGAWALVLSTHLEIRR